MAEKWIQGAGIKKGALHRQLGIPESEPIPESTLESAASKGGTLGRRARLAMTLKRMSKSKGKR